MEIKFIYPFSFYLHTGKSNSGSLSTPGWCAGAPEPVFSVLVQHPVHVLHVMSPASAGDVKVGSSLNVSWEKGEGEETHRRQKLRKFNRYRNGFREVIFTSEN